MLASRPVAGWTRIGGAFMTSIMVRLLAAVITAGLLAGAVFTAKPLRAAENDLTGSFYTDVEYFVAYDEIDRALMNEARACRTTKRWDCVNAASQLFATRKIIRQQCIILAPGSGAVSHESRMQFDGCLATVRENDHFIEQVFGIGPPLGATTVPLPRPRPR
jgi:hypothetical protein